MSSSVAITVAACGGGSSGGSNASDGSTAAGTSSDPTDTADASQNLTDWLAGGADAMEVAFPPSTDPLDLSTGNTICTLTGTNAYTIGPCYFDVSDYREDISEGQAGVPMTLALKLVDADCNPVADADIEVWWCNWEGLYSGDNSESAGIVSSFNSGFCTGNDAQALQARWFRGVQRTDSTGNVYFKACFPGWYRGRTTHIHFRVVTGGAQRLISQFCFDDDLCNDIYENHSEYTGIAKDTLNSNDNVFGGDWSDYQFIVERQSDGSMLAYKAIQIV